MEPARRACSVLRSRSARCRRGRRSTSRPPDARRAEPAPRRALAHPRCGRQRAPRCRERARARGARRSRVPRAAPRTTRPSARSAASSRRRPTRSRRCSAVCARTQPILAATALCHLRDVVPRRSVGSASTRPSAAAIRPMLESDPRAVADADRDVRARPTRPDRAPTLNRRGARSRGERALVDDRIRAEVDRACSRPPHREVELLHGT